MGNLKRRLITDREQSAQAEAFRSFRMALQDIADQDHIQSILFVGSSQSEEYGLTVANVAIALAYAGKKVVLLDCDLRHPFLYQVFHVENTGVVSVLRDGKKIDEVLQPSHLKNLMMISSGISVEPPVSMLASHKLSDLLEDLKGRFDYVLINSSPLLVTSQSVLSETCVVAAKVDGVVLMVESCQVKVSKAQKIVQLLQGTKAKILGLLLIKVKLDDAFFHAVR